MVKLDENMSKAADYIDGILKKICNSCTDKHCKERNTCILHNGVYYNITCLNQKQIKELRRLLGD